MELKMYCHMYKYESTKIKIKIKKSQKNKQTTLTKMEMMFFSMRKNFQQQAIWSYNPWQNSINKRHVKTKKV